MTYIRWFFFLLFWAVFASFLHYTLPQNDVVRVIGTYERRIDFGSNSIFWAQPDSGAALNNTNRDVFFVQTLRSNGDEMIYRNEDTGWGWPPYFKFDTANVYAQLSDLASTADDPVWVVVRHYGWRNKFFSIFPNVLSARVVDSPDVRIIPWMNIILLTLLAAAFWAVRTRWIRFRENRIDPILERIGDWCVLTWGAISRGLFGKKS
ncbi:MAG: DUF1523 family protein [Paracoccaceae bacterium]